MTLSSHQHGGEVKMSNQTVDSKMINGNLEIEILPNISNKKLNIIINN